MAEWMFLFPCAKLNLPCSPGSGGRALRAVSELDVQRLRRQGHLLCFLTRRGILQWLICQLREFLNSWAKPGASEGTRVFALGTHSFLCWNGMRGRKHMLVVYFQCSWVACRCLFQHILFSKHEVRGRQCDPVNMTGLPCVPGEASTDHPSHTQLPM